MWPFHDKVDPNRIEIHLHFLDDADVPSFTVKLVSQGQTVLEGSGLMLGADFRLCDIKTEPEYRGRFGFGTTAIGALIGAARARRCATFTIEGVAPDNHGAIRLYQRFGALVLPLKKPGGLIDFQLRL